MVGRKEKEEWGEGWQTTVRRQEKEIDCGGGG